MTDNDIIPSIDTMIDQAHSTGYIQALMLYKYPFGTPDHDECQAENEKLVKQRNANRRQIVDAINRLIDERNRLYQAAVQRLAEREGECSLGELIDQYAAVSRKEGFYNGRASDIRLAGDDQAENARLADNASNMADALRHKISVALGDPTELDEWMAEVERMGHENE
jgi:hypothetical protein